MNYFLVLCLRQNILTIFMLSKKGFLAMQNDAGLFCSVTQEIIGEIRKLAPRGQNNALEIHVY